MTKHARIVFEEEIPDNATLGEAAEIIFRRIESYMLNHPNIEDIEISDSVYEPGL